MVRFTIRDVLWLTALAGASLWVGRVWLRADMWEEYALVFGMFLFGAACYIASIWLVRRARST